MIPTQEQRHPFEEAVANMYSNPAYSNTYLFYAHLIGQCRVVFTADIDVAAVNFTHDHFNLYINPEGFNSLSLVQRLAVLKHEMLHILSNHLARKGDRDHERFNYAADCAINQLIDQKHLPDNAVLPEHFNFPKNLTAEQYYELFSDNNSDDDGNGNGNGQLLDDHSAWSKSQGDAELQADITKSMLEKAAANTQKSRGNVPAEFSAWLSLVSRKREISWQQLLRNITGNKRVSSRKTLMRRDRRLPNYEWIKGRTKARRFDLLVVADVSGSVDDDDLLRLLGEVRHICDVTQSSVNLIQVDTVPSKPEQLSKNTKVIERKACGGTILYPAIEEAKKHRLDFQAVVVTTDGYLDPEDVLQFATLNKKIIWLVNSNGCILPEMTTNGMQAFQLKD